MRKPPMLFVAAILIVLGLIWLGVAELARPAVAADPSSLDGLASLSGAVQAPKPFKAAQVHIMNVDKQVLFMVYTSGGRYRAPNLFPGKYEVTVRKAGFGTDTQTITLAAGAKATLDFSLREQAGPGVRQGEFGFTSGAGTDVKLLSYDELYPRESGRVLLEKNCMYCHGKNFFPSKQYHETQWNAFIDLMTGATASERGAMVPPGALSQPDRATLLAYLSRQFGPGSLPRGLRVDTEFPVDEAALGKAMYVEYYLPLDPKLDAGNKQRRTQQPHFDQQGNVWYTDRSIPNRIGRVDPRTGQFKDWVMPDPKADPHGLTVDARGHVWFAETAGFHLGELDPATGSIMRYPMDSTGRSKGRGHSPAVDSKQNVWFTVIQGDMIGKWDRQTGKSIVWKVPTQGAAPYGIALDKDDNVWFAEFRRCKIGKFDPRTERFTEYVVPSQPCTIRRLGVDSQSMVWYGDFSNGKLGKIDPTTGKIVQYDIPMPFSEPYDVWADREDAIWISDGGQGGALIRFDQRTKKFTYYPTPQITDQPKLAITREGAIWYTPRSSLRAAVGVLYPNVEKITTLAASY
jgi:virginiamycin B lyase